MLDAARKHKRVVQVGTQRRSTPHLIDARDEGREAGLLGKVGMAEVYCYYHMRRTTQLARRRSRRRTSTTKRGPAPPRCGPTTARDTPIRTATPPAPPLVAGVLEYGNGIVGDMCIHMLDMVRWMFDLGWPREVSLHRRHPRAEEEQVEHLRHADRDVRLPRVPGGVDSTAPGAKSADPEYPWGATIYGDKGTLKLSVNKYEFFPMGSSKPKLSGTALFEYDKYPGRQDGEGPGEARRVGDPRAHARLPQGPREPRQAGRGHRAGPHLDRDLHPGEPVDEARPLAEVGSREARGGERRRGEQAPQRPYRTGYTHPAGG